MRFDDLLQQFVPDQLPEGVFACGRVNGAYRLESRMNDGERAGLAAAAHAGHGAAGQCDGRIRDRPSHAWPIVAHPDGKNFVDFDEDLQLKDFENAVQEGYDNIELLKRFSTVGMGPSQGKHSNMTALRILARLTGKSPQQVGTTTARPFFHPVPMSHLGGRGFEPQRAVAAAHAARGARCGVDGRPVSWQRPEYYRSKAITHRLHSRRSHGVCATAVGHHRRRYAGQTRNPRGPQAGEFLNRVYTRYAGLKVGIDALCGDVRRIRRADRRRRGGPLAEDLFYFTTTTSGAATDLPRAVALNTRMEARLRASST
jgi:sarcosine oxidase subunit alpha